MLLVVVVGVCVSFSGRVFHHHHLAVLTHILVVVIMVEFHLKLLVNMLIFRGFLGLLISVLLLIFLRIDFFFSLSLAFGLTHGLMWA